MSPHVVVDVSSHGLGHLGQVAPVLRALKTGNPDLRLTIRSGHNHETLRSFLGGLAAFDVAPPEATLCMQGPSTIDIEASRKAYRDLHLNWDAHLSFETARLAALKPSALVSDVPYLSIAAAKRLGIPTIALCSLNWADIYRAYCVETKEDDDILAVIEDAYASADLFLQPTPHMPMNDLGNKRTIGPLARVGEKMGSRLRELLGLSSEKKIVLVSLGGIPSRKKLQLPKIPDVHWLIGSTVTAPKDCATEVASLEWNFVDVLASSDAVVTKVGYSTFAEAVCNGVGLVSASRDDWPETPYLAAWAQEHANFQWVRPGLERGDALEGSLKTVLNAGPREPVPPSGVEEACRFICDTAGMPSHVHAHG